MSRKVWFNERLRHAYIAIGIALLAGVISLLKPLDVAVWTLQSKLASNPASGEIVFVELQPASEFKRDDGHRALAQSVRTLREYGADRIFINVPLHESQVPDADRELRNSLRDNRAHVFLAYSAAETTSALPDYFTDGLVTYDNHYDFDFLGYVWNFDAHGADGRKSLSFALPSFESSREVVAIDGTIDARTIPRLSSATLETALKSLDTSGKTFVIGSDTPEDTVRLANNAHDPSTIAHILAAETLIRGSGQVVFFIWTTIVLGGLLIAGIVFCRERQQRRKFYAAWIALISGGIVAAGLSGVQANFAYPLAIAIIYGIMRAIANYRQRHLYVDPISELPNFSALRRDLEEDADRQFAGVVVVKVLRLDSIFAELAPAERRLYLKQIASRLALTSREAKIYFDGGKYLAFLIGSLGPYDYESHLSGLRAIASQPVVVSGRLIDVAITIGADVSDNATRENRLSSAIAAADQAREAFRPVFVVSDTPADTDSWDHSLTARLAEALAEDRITIKLQPQVDLKTGAYTGAEVLARWQDEDGREIPPARFISQCERMGRLDDLTKRIFEKGLAAAQALQNAGHDITLSINVSAVQFVDERIVEIVESCLHKRPVDPAKIRIEVTETARIEDLETARAIFERLQKRGIRFSLDDFGVGSANLEALQRLPFEEIKIDRMFTLDLLRSRMARAIVAGAIKTASEAGIVCIAEGIEDGDTKALLARMGCDYGQGYFIARPQPVSQFVTTLDLGQGRLFRKKTG